MLRIAVCGDGPTAHSIALMAAHLGQIVRVLVADPAGWSDRLRGTLPGGRRIEAPLQAVSASPTDCIPGSDLVLVCVPHSRVAQMLAAIAPHLTGRMLVGGVPGFGGFGIKARQLLPAGTCIFGLQRIPFVVRAHSSGRSVRISGIRRQTYVAAIPAARSLAVSELVGRMLAVRSVPVSHYVNIELSPSNSVVNPARLYALFGASVGLAAETEFFTGWDEASSEMLLHLDAELQSGRRLIPRDTSFVAPILLQYDANDARTLTMRFRSLTTLSGRPVPIRMAGGLRVLAPQSSYVIEDIDHGLAGIRAILRLAGAPTPLADEILRWRAKLEPTSGTGGTLPGAAPVAPFADIEALMAALD